MSLLAVQGGATGTGTVTLLAPVTNSNQTLTLPDATGTVLTTATAGVPVNGPAFSATTTTAQSFSNSTFTKVQFNIETFDTNSNYDPTTNYRFTPTVAGYYQINGNVSFVGAAAGFTQCAIFKNGSQFIDGSGIPNNVNVGGKVTAASVISFNGSTDYVEFFAWQNSGGALVLSTATGNNSFSGAMVRSAV
jgi:hypothetical protein